MRNGQLRLSNRYNYKQGHDCSCGRTVRGPLAKASHRRACTGEWLTWQERRAAQEKGETG